MSRNIFEEIVNQYIDMDFCGNSIIDKLLMSEQFLEVFNSHRFYIDTEDEDIVRLVDPYDTNLYAVGRNIYDSVELIDSGANMNDVGYIYIDPIVIRIAEDLKLVANQDCSIAELVNGTYSLQLFNDYETITLLVARLEELVKNYELMALERSL